MPLQLQARPERPPGCGEFCLPNRESERELWPDSFQSTSPKVAKSVLDDACMKISEAIMRNGKIARLGLRHYD